MIMGEPIVRKEMYMNQILIRDVAMPIRSPISEHTPNAFHSIKSFMLFSLRIYVDTNVLKAGLIINMLIPY